MVQRYRYLQLDSLFLNYIQIALHIMHNQSDSAEARPLRKVTEAQAKKYQEMLGEFQKEYERQPSLQASDDVDYYLVSVKFLKTWRDFCMASEEERQVPTVMNEDLLQPGTKKLKQGLAEKEDFEILTEAVYRTFQEFHANEIKRHVVTLGFEKRIPIYLNEYKYLIVTSKLVKDVDKIIKKKEVIPLKTIEESENATVEELTTNIMRKEENEVGYNARLWKISKDQGMDGFFNHVCKATEKLYSYMNLRIKGFGKKLSSDVKIQEVNMEEGDFFVVELKEKDRKWFLSAENEKQCEGCYDFAELKFQCKCKNAAYCTELCQEKDKHYHMRKCEYAEMEEFNKNFRMEITEYSRKGKVGLRNLGNTCFMNSCLQCLSNTQPLTQYFLRRLFEPEINRTNPLGTKGKLARNYALFIKGMWCERQSVYSPDNIKSAVASINPMFSGYAQHDSQEFFSFIIDGIHEDLNRVEKKPYVESIESSNRTDKQVATESWFAHTKRNQSIITDLMTGQYKSKVTCPSCQKESITFDPFITVTLPISEKITNNFECFVFSKNFEERTKKINFAYGKPNLQQWKKSIAKITGIEQSSLEIYLVSIYEGIYLAGRDSLTDIVYKMQNQNKNVFVFELSEQDRRIADRIDIPSRLCKRTYSQYENSWFKFPLFFDRNATTGLDIYKKVLKFLYPTTYVQKGKSNSSEDYNKYQALMLQKRPFKLVMKYNRKVDKHYSRIEFKYGAEMDIQDETTLEQVWRTVDCKECELDIRFNPEGGASQFDIKNLKEFDDVSKKARSSAYEDNSFAAELKDCFYNLSEEQELEKGNQWYCSNCKDHKLAKKVIQIYKAPKILILHLKRFKNKGAYRKQKNQTRVHFPEVLDMGQFLIDESPMTSYNEEAKKKNILIPPKYPGNYAIPCSDKPIYDLYAVSNHYGGLGGGHYTAYAKNGTQWYDFNDSSVREVSKQSIQGSSAYILFYKRRDQ